MVRYRPRQERHPGRSEQWRYGGHLGDHLSILTYPEKDKTKKPPGLYPGGFYLSKLQDIFTLPLKLIITASYLINIISISCAIAFLASLTVFFFPTDQRWLRHFSLFLLVICLLTWVENYLAIAKIDNTEISNISTVVEFTFYLYMFREIVVGRRAKKTFYTLVFAYPIVAVINIFLIQRNGFHTMTYALGCLLIIGSCIYYFWELFQRNSSINLGRQPSFWICSGLLFYYTCNFPLYGAANLFKVMPHVILSNLLAILVLLNILLYLSFIIAFLCRLKTRKFMSS
jgi:hypothetical protein